MALHCMPVLLERAKQRPTGLPCTGWSLNSLYPSGMHLNFECVVSDGTIRTALKSLGYNSYVMTTHGFRTTASTLLNEQGWSPDAIERQLAHASRNHVRAAHLVHL